MALQAENVE